MQPRAGRRVRLLRDVIHLCGANRASREACAMRMPGRGRLHTIRTGSPSQRRANHREIRSRRGRIASFLWSLGAQPARLHRIALLKVFRARRFVFLVGCRFSNFLAAALLALGHRHSPLLCAPGAACRSIARLRKPIGSIAGRGSRRLQWRLRFYCAPVKSESRDRPCASSAATIINSASRRTGYLLEHSGGCIL